MSSPATTSSPASRCSAAPARNASPATRICARTPKSRCRPASSRRLSWKGGELMNQFLNLSSFAEQMLVHENSMVKIDPDIPLDRAALVGCGVMTGVGAVFNAAKVEPGATVAVIGCGGVGLSAVNGAALGRRRAHHRDRHRRLEARSRARTRRHRHVEREQRRPGQGGQGHDRRRRALLVRGARHQDRPPSRPSACCARAAPRRSSAWCRSA